MAQTYPGYYRKKEQDYHPSVTPDRSVTQALSVNPANLTSTDPLPGKTSPPDSSARCQGRHRSGDCAKCRHHGDESSNKADGTKLYGTNDAASLTNKVQRNKTKKKKKKKVEGESIDSKRLRRQPPE